jgi:hypothetical protein
VLRFLGVASCLQDVVRQPDQLLTDMTILHRHFLCSTFHSQRLCLLCVSAVFAACGLLPAGCRQAAVPTADRRVLFQICQRNCCIVRLVSLARATPASVFLWYVWLLVCRMWPGSPTNCLQT